MSTLISADGTTIAYDVTGSGPALILVGGAFQHRAIDPRTEQLAKLLSNQFTVYHYDRRGRGGSGDTAPYAVTREIEDIAALVEQAGGAAFLYGMSSGAALALDAAAVVPGIGRIAVYEPPLVVDDSRPPIPADYLPTLRDLVAADRRTDAVALFLTTAALVPAEFVEQMKHAPMWPDFEAVANTLPYDGEIMGDGTGKPLAGARWAGVAIPALVIDGGDSPTHMRNAADAVAAVLADANRETIPGQQHDVAAELLAPVLTAFYLH